MSLPLIHAPSPITLPGCSQASFPWGLSSLLSSSEIQARQVKASWLKSKSKYDRLKPSVTESPNHVIGESLDSVQCLEWHCWAKSEKPRSMAHFDDPMERLTSTPLNSRAPSPYALAPAVTRVFLVGFVFSIFNFPLLVPPRTGLIAANSCWGSSATYQVAHSALWRADGSG